MMSEPQKIFCQLHDKPAHPVQFISSVLFHVVRAALKSALHAI